MRRFVKLHPWRLEIVPAVAFSISVAAWVLYRLRGNSALPPMGGDLDRELSLSILGSIIFVGALWFLGLNMNHNWVISEREKRFNALALALQFGMLLQAAEAIGIYWLVTEPAAFRFVWWLFAGLPVCGLLFTFVMELTRRFMPRPEEPEPALDWEAPTCSYIDTEVYYGFAASGACFALVAVVAVAYCRDYAVFGTGLAGAILMGSFTYRRVIVARVGLVVRWGFIRKRFATSSISGCRAAHRHMFDRSGPQRVKLLCITTGRCLEITTTDGKVYAIGMVRPNYACRMLEAFISEKREC